MDGRPGQDGKPGPPGAPGLRVRSKCLTFTFASTYIQRRYNSDACLIFLQGDPGKQGDPGRDVSLLFFTLCTLHTYSMLYYNVAIVRH